MSKKTLTAIALTTLVVISTTLSAMTSNPKDEQQIIIDAPQQKAKDNDWSIEIIALLITGCITPIVVAYISNRRKN